MLLPAVQAARRTQCVNNLKQIGLAFHNYHSVNERSPTGECTRPNNLGARTFWTCYILPFMELGTLGNAYNYSMSINTSMNGGASYGPINSTVTQASIKMFNADSTMKKSISPEADKNHFEFKLMPSGAYE